MEYARAKLGMDFMAHARLRRGMALTRLSDNYLENCYRLAAIRGVQAGRAFYVAMLPFRMIGRLFPEVQAETAGRKLNKARVRPLAEYLASPSCGHVVPPVHVSVCGEMRFEGAVGLRSAGTVQIDLHASFDVIDGQHRIAGIKAANLQSPTLAREALPVCLYVALDRNASLRMFDTLNRKLVKPPAGIA